MTRWIVRLQAPAATAARLRPLIDAGVVAPDGTVLVEP